MKQARLKRPTTEATSALTLARTRYLECRPALGELLDVDRAGGCLAVVAAAAGGRAGSQAAARLCCSAVTLGLCWIYAIIWRLDITLWSRMCTGERCGLYTVLSDYYHKTTLSPKKMCSSTVCACVCVCVFVFVRACARAPARLRACVCIRHHGSRGSGEAPHDGKAYHARGGRSKLLVHDGAARARGTGGGEVGGGAGRGKVTSRRPRNYKAGPGASGVRLAILSDGQSGCWASFAPFTYTVRVAGPPSLGLEAGLTAAGAGRVAAAFDRSNLQAQPAETTFRRSPCNWQSTIIEACLLLSCRWRVSALPRPHSPDTEALRTPFSPPARLNSTSPLALACLFFLRFGWPQLCPELRASQALSHCTTFIHEWGISITLHDSKVS